MTINGSSTTGSRRGFNGSSSGVVTVTGNFVGGSQSSAFGGTTNGTLNVTGNSNGGSGSNAYGINGAGTVTLTGTSTGGSGTTSSGILVGVSATVGAATGGSNANSAGIATVTGVVTVNGTTTGGSHATAYGANVTGAGRLLLNAVTASSTTPAVADSSGASSAFVRVAGPITNSTGVNALYVQHLCLVAECDWTIAKAGTPPAYNGTVTIGLKSGGGGGGLIVSRQMTGGYQ